MFGLGAVSPGRSVERGRDTHLRFEPALTADFPSLRHHGNLNFKTRLAHETNPHTLLAGELLLNATHEE